jgi:transcription elongation GreA/GreB family factor
MDIHFKEQVIALFMQQLTELIESYQNNLQDLNESAANETKSTAGDKHETALAMLQIEQKNARSRLEEVNKRKSLLEAAAAIKTTSRIVNGSLVNTNQGYFLIAAALGKVVIEGQVIMAVSPSSPLGAKLLGLQVGDSFQLNTNTFVIMSVV